MTPCMELYNDNFQNYRRYNIPRAQLVSADIPYNIGANAYGSSPLQYVIDCLENALDTVCGLK